MPAERTTMRQVREILRLHEAGLSTRQIGIRVGVAASTVRLTLRRVAAAGMVNGLAVELTDAVLERALFAAAGKKSGHRQHAEPAWPAIHQELRRKHVTLTIVWDEYIAAHPGGYRYSRFCELYRGGFVSSRARVLIFGLTRGQLRILHDIERNAGRLGEAGATKGSGDDLIVTATRAKKIAEFAVFSTEALGGIMAFEASHTSDPALDAAMVLFKTIVQVGTGPVPHGLAQHGADCSGVGAMTVCRDPVRSKTHGRPRRAEEGLGRLHITMLAQLRVDQVSVPVDRPVEVAPPAANFQVRLVDIPADPGSAPGSVTPFAQRVAHDRQQLCLPVADSLMADFDPA